MSSKDVDPGAKPMQIVAGRKTWTRTRTRTMMRTGVR